jgi:hypothetical protein
MDGESHDGVVAFTPLPSGREAVMLGLIQVGEISPVHDPRSRYPICYRIELPWAATRAWEPASDIAEAHRLALRKINDWLNAAGLRPNGAA